MKQETIIQSTKWIRLDWHPAEDRNASTQHHEKKSYVISFKSKMIMKTCLYSLKGLWPDFLQDLVCSCKGKMMRGRSCVCNEQNMCCTELCPCQGCDFCMNPFSRSRENDREYEGDEENDAD